MDAEQVLELASTTGSNIRFANDETQDLVINNQLPIHPLAVNQLLRSYTRTKNTEMAKNDLEEIMRITQQYDTNQMAKKDYLECINGVLQKHQMITEAEITEVQNKISDENKKMFENMTAPLAFRIRTVLKGTSPGDMEAAQKIAEFMDVDGGDVAKNPFEFANCVEIQKVHFSKQVKALELAKISIIERNGMYGMQIQEAINHLYGEYFDLPHEDMLTMNDNTVSKKKKNKRLGEIFAHNVVNNNQRRAVIVQGINERITLIGLYETGPLSFSSSLSAYYHVEKHGKEAARVFYLVTSTELPEDPCTKEDVYEIYFEKMPKLLFTKENYKSTTISQDGRTITRTWANKLGYVGLTKAPYTPVAELDLPSDPPLYLPGETVASHYQKEKISLFHILLFCCSIVGISRTDIVIIVSIIVKCIVLVVFVHVMVEHFTLPSRNVLDLMVKLVVRYVRC
ncbi:hypothetical protein Y032_0033g2790 [Ancylostoma ceylanicum]|nr:hypothetical protein Y032_0033g2790 [Ancylostoma ceylanicum]